MDANEIYNNILPFEEAKHDFKVFIPEAGEYRIILDKCSTTKITDLYFISSNGQKDLLEGESKYA